MSRRNQTQRIRLSDSSQVSPGQWSFGSRQDLGLDEHKKNPIRFIQQGITQLTLAPYRSAIAELLTFFEISPESFTDLPLDLKRPHNKGYYFSILDGLYRALDRGYGSGTKDKLSLDKLSVQLNDVLGDTRNAKQLSYWQEKLADVSIEILPNKSQWALNKQHAFAYDGFVKGPAGVKRRVLFIAPHLLNPVISEKARKFLLTLVISKFMAEDWAKKQRESERPHKLYKAVARRAKFLGIKHGPELDKAVANVLIARELIKNPEIVGHKKAALVREPLGALRLGEDPPSFFIGMNKVLEGLPLCPGFMPKDIWETFRKARSMLSQKEARDIPVELTRIYAIIQHNCTRDDAPIAEPHRLRALNKITARGNWLAHKKQPLQVVLAGMLVGLGEVDPHKFSSIIERLKSDELPLIRSVAVLAEIQMRWGSCFAHSPEIPRGLDNNYFEQNELDRVVGSWTTAAHEYVKAFHENEKAYEGKQIKYVSRNQHTVGKAKKTEVIDWQAYADGGWKNIREQIAFLTSSRFVVDLNRDYSDLSPEAIRTQANIARFSVSRGLRKIGLSAVADKLAHEALVLRGEQYYAINQSIRDGLGMDPEESEIFVRAEGQQLQAILRQHGVDCSVSYREKTLDSERGKIIDTYRENLERMLRGEPSLFTTDCPTIADIHRQHIDTLGLMLIFHTQEDLAEGWKNLSHHIEASKSEDALELLIANNPQAARSIREKFRDFQNFHDPKTGQMAFLRTLVVAQHQLIDLHFATDSYSVDAKEGIADMKYARAHSDMKSQRDVENFAFFNFLREKGVSFNEEGMPSSVKAVLSLYPEFLKLKEKYHPYRDYRNRIGGLHAPVASSIESQLVWHADEAFFSITPPPEVVIAEVVDGAFRNRRVISGSSLNEIALDKDGYSRRCVLEKIHMLNPPGCISYPGGVIHLTEHKLSVRDYELASPRGAVEVLGKRSVEYVDALTPKQAIDRIIGDTVLANPQFATAYAPAVIQAIVDAWREEIFAPVAGNYGLSPDELMLLIAKGDDELKQLPMLTDTVGFLKKKVCNRFEQTFVSFSADEVHYDQEKGSFSVILDFDERRRGLVQWFFKHLAREAAADNLTVSLLNFVVDYPDNSSSSLGVCERNTYELALWDVPSSAQEREVARGKFHSMLNRTLSLMPYDLISRVKVTPALTVDRKMSVVLPQEPLSFKKFIDCIYSLGLGIKSTIEIKPATADVSLLLCCEELRQYGVTSIEELMGSKYTSEAIGNLRRETLKLEQALAQELPKFFSADQAKEIITSLSITDPSQDSIVSNIL